MGFKLSTLMLITTLGALLVGNAAFAACNFVPAGSTVSTVWRAGAGADWYPPEAASGGINIAQAAAVSVDATSAYAKLKFVARPFNQNATFEYVEFDLRAVGNQSVGQLVGVYVIDAQSGDTFNSRCSLTLKPNWTRVRLALSGIGVTGTARIEQLRFRNDAGKPIRFDLRNISFGKSGGDGPEDPDEPTDPDDPDLRPKPGIPISRCTAADGETLSQVWANGPSNAWLRPEPLGGGASVSTNTTIDVNATLAYGKIRIRPRTAVAGFDWIQFDIRSEGSAAANVDVYIYATDLGDTYAKRCRVGTTTDWQRFRVPLTAFGGSAATEFGQIRFRNASGGPLEFSLNNVLLGGRNGSGPDDPDDPPQPDSRLPTSERLTNWAASTGATLPSTRAWTVVDIAPPPANVDASVIINRRLAESDNVIVQLTPGRYTLKNGLRITGRNKILRGAAGGGTTLFLDGVHGAGLQLGADYRTGSEFRIQRGVKGSRTLRVAGDSNQIQALRNRVIEIDRLRSTLADDEPERGLIYRRGQSDRLPGQLNRVVDVNGNRLTLADPLHLDYVASTSSPALRPLVIYGENIGLENLTLRGANLQNLGSGIYARGVRNIWIRNVVSRRIAVKSHVELVAVYRCSVQSNVFDDAVSHSNGGQGYGVNLALHTSGCLIEDNIFNRLRHSMILNLGAAGNALLYNYSTQPVHPHFEVGGPGDISFHGNYTSANLVEGNVVRRVSIADDCCKAEVHNTFLRNCLLSGPMTLRFGSDEQNIVANAMYGSDAKLRATLIDGGAVRPAGRLALGPGEGPLFNSPLGRDGVYVYPDNPSTRLDEDSKNLIEYANYYNGRFWYNGRVGGEPTTIPSTYFYTTPDAQRRSVFATPPRRILNSPSGNESLDCDTPARRRAPRWISE